MFAFFERLIEAFPTEEPKQPPNSLLSFCLHYSKEVWGALLVVALLGALIAMAEVWLFGLIGSFVDWLTVANPETFFIENRNQLIFYSLVVVIFIPMASLLHALFVHQGLLGNYPMSIRWLAHKYLLNQSLSFYQNDFAGRIATKLMQTSLAIRETVLKLVDVLVYISVYFISMLVLVAQADIRLAIPMLIWFCAYVALQFVLVPKMRAVSMLQADARSLMTGRVVDSYTNIQTVKLFAHTQQEAEYAQNGMSEFMDTVYKQMRLVTLLNIGVETINYFLVFVIAAMGLWLWSLDAITVGSIAVALGLALRINGMSHWIMWEVSALFENIGTVTDGMNTISQPRLVQDVKDAVDIEVTDGKIHFNQVDFHYGEEKPVISQLNLQIQPGEKIGLVGRSGAGKSTLVNLLLRFYDIESGEIRIDGQNISQVSQESLRAQVGMVTQDTMLLHRSVRENILYGKPGATEEELIAACKKAQAYDFIQSLVDPKGNTGFDAQVGERGVKLSGGQRQRIAIARVLLKDAPILVLDEATSALDSEVEAAIQENLYQLMKGKTVIAIAHRLSTIAAMDRLVVMDKGEIVEQGRHAELVTQDGIYAHLWRHQTGGFLAET